MDRLGFSLLGSLDLAIFQGINGNKCAADTRTLYSSNPNSDQQYIKASSDNGKLTLKYGFLEHNSDCWASYVIRGIDEVKTYCRKGYYISLTCFSTSVSEFVLELKHPERKFPINVTTDKITYYGKLTDIVNMDRINELSEICFVLRPASANKLQGRLQISDLRLLKNKMAVSSGKSISINSA